MITFVVDAAGSFGIRDYLAHRGLELAGRIDVLHYEELGSVTALAESGTIFAGLDQPGKAALAAAAAMHDELTALHPAVPVLNHPRRVRLRYDLLRRLFESGCNRFNVIRATDDPGVLRYPVFVRYEHRHNGSLTPLLHDRQALDRALVDLACRGIASRHLLVVEFCDTSGPDGLFRKYSAMRIGDAIIPRHLHAGSSWVAKSSNTDEDEALAREELAYIQEHPHESWLRSVFDEANIEYGRIDYGMYRGQPQVWEINTNPTLGRRRARGPAPPGPLAKLREPGRLAAHRLMVDAFRRLDRDEYAVRSFDLPVSVKRQLSAEAQSRRRGAFMGRVRRSLLDNRVSQSAKGLIRGMVCTISPAAARLLRKGG